MKQKITNQLAILCIIILGWAIRLTYLSYINQSPPQDGMLFVPLCGVDAHIYDQYGQDILQGKWPGIVPLFRTPLYTLYLGLNYQLAGVNHYSPLIVQALIHIMAMAALYRVGAFIFSSKTGLIAALGYVLYGPLIFYTGCFAQASLVVPLLIFALFFLVAFWVSAQKIGYLVLSGLMIGLAGLGRPTMLVVLFAAVVWLFWETKNLKRASLYSLIIGITAILPIIPVALFNYTVANQFIPVSTNGPEVFFISNNLDAEGRDILSPGIEQPVHQRFGRVTAQIRQGETTYVKEVINYITHNPLDWLILEANKLWLLFGKPDLNLLTIAYAYPTTKNQIRIFEIMPVQWAGLILSALMAMFLVRRKHALLLLFFFGFITLANIIFFIQLRFRLLLIPIILLYAAALITSAPAWFRYKRGRFYTVLLILLLGMPFAYGLWLFAIILLGIGIWQSIKINLWQDTKWPLLTAWTIFIIALLLAQIINSANRAGQSEDYYLGPEIMGDIFLGQTFQPDCDGLNRVRLTMGVHSNTHTQPVEFHLLSQTNNQEIFVDHFLAETIADRMVKDFVFSAQPNSKQQQYLAYLISPTSHPGNSVTIRGFSDLPADWYAGGTAIAGQGEQVQPLPGDLAFAVFCAETSWMYVNRAFSQLPGHPWIYWAVLIVHLLLLLLATIKIITQQYQVYQKAND